MTMTNISTIGGLSNKTPTKISKKFISTAWKFFKIVLVRIILFICTMNMFVESFFFFLQSWSYKYLDYDLFKTNVPTIQKPGNWFYLIFLTDQLTGLINWLEHWSQIDNKITYLSYTFPLPFSDDLIYHPLHSHAHHDSLKIKLFCLHFLIAIWLRHNQLSAIFERTAS